MTAQDDPESRSDTHTDTRDRTGKHRRANALRWAAVLVLAIGLLVSIAAWYVARTHDRSGLQWATQLAAQAIRIDIMTDMGWQVLGLDRLALLWEAADPAQELWKRNAELYIQHRPGCVAVEWLTSSGEKRAVITEGGRPRALAFDGMPTSLVEAANEAKIAIISAPDPLPDGSRQWAIAYPVYARGQSRGFIVSFFDLEQSLAYVLGDLKHLNVSFAVSVPHGPEYLLPGTSRELEREWGTVLEVPLSGTAWKIRVWPNADVVNKTKSVLPEVTLGVGIILSLLLGSCLYFAGGAVISSTQIERLNKNLLHEIELRERARRQLRRAHVELEMRIGKRTAELAATNELLQKEVTAHQRAEESLEDLAGRLFRLRDQERRRLARELHDGAVQNLIALGLDVAMIGEAVSAKDVSTKERVRKCARLIEQSTSELRVISYLLHPPYFDELGLAASLGDFVAGFDSRTGIRVTLDIDSKLERLDSELELAIFRIVQEALSNVYHHAQSETAAVSVVRNDNEVELKITDVGRGIPAEMLAAHGGRLAGVGIAGMRERVRLLGGRLTIQSGSTGTSIQAVFPVPPLPPEREREIVSGVETSAI